MRTLCFTGMDRAEEAKLKLLFSDANEWLGGGWVLMPEAQADVLVVDLESIYGHMTWLKVHNSSKYVIALTSRSASESEAEHLLTRPVTVEGLVAALSQASGDAPPISQTVTAERAAVPMRAAETNPPQVAAPMPVAQAAPQRPSQPVPVPAATPAPVAREAAPAPAAPAAAPKPAAPLAQPRDPVLWDYLRPGGLPSPSRLELAGAPPLVIDPRTDTFIGGPALKPYIPYCELGTVRADRWQTLSGAELNAHLAPPNEAHPLARLRWLFALVQGGGELAPGYDPNDKFRLVRWPKTEREFPRHFRIATAMMQAPSSPTEIAAQSDTALGEVNDFLNASLDSGFAEPHVDPPATPDSGPKSGGLLGRLRGMRNG